MSTQVFHLHFHVQPRCLRQSSYVSINSSHCVVPQATSILIVEHHFFPRRSNIILHKKESLPAKQHHTTQSEMANVNGTTVSSVREFNSHLNHSTYRFPIGKWYFRVCYTRSDHSCEPQQTLHPMRGSSHFNVVLCVVCHYHHG